MPQTISRYSARILDKEKDIKKNLEEVKESIDNIDNILTEKEKVKSKNIKSKITN